MIARVIGLVKAAVYKIEYGRSIQFHGHPIMVQSAKINIRNGKMCIGKSFSVKANTYFAIVNGGTIVVGDGVSINRNCIMVCHDTITIGDGCAIGPNTVIFDHDHRFGPEGIRQGFHTGAVTIGSNCWIGAGVTILRGTSIGEGCVIGAGAIVKGDIPAHSLVTSGRELTITPIEDRKLS